MRNTAEARVVQKEMGTQLLPAYTCTAGQNYLKIPACWDQYTGEKLQDMYWMTYCFLLFAGRCFSYSRDIMGTICEMLSNDNSLTASSDICSYMSSQLLYEADAMTLGDKLPPEPEPTKKQYMPLYQ